MPAETRSLGISAIEKANQNASVLILAMMVAGGARLRAPRVVYPGGDHFYGGGLERHTSLRRPATLKKTNSKDVCYLWLNY